MTVKLIEEVTSSDLVSKSVSTLKRMLKTATPEESKEIWAELNCRGVYARGKGSKSNVKEGVKYPNGQICRDDSVDMDRALDYNFGTDRDPDNSHYTDEEKQRSLDYYVKHHDGFCPMKEHEQRVHENFEYNENSEEDRILYDAISTFFADVFCGEFDININEVSQYPMFESLMESLVKIVKQGRYDRDH